MNKTNTKYALNKSWLTCFLIGLFIFIPSLIISAQHNFASMGWELSVFRYFNNGPNSFKTPALWITEGLGAGYPIAACILISLAFKRLRLAWQFFVCVGATGVIMEIAKFIAKEPRPYAMLHGHLKVRAIELGLNSYPSGHAAVATAMALVVWLLLPKAWRWLAVLWVALVCVSRLYLGVHTPLDVLGGVAIGLTVFSFIRLLPLPIAKRLKIDSRSMLKRYSAKNIRPVQ